VAASRLYIIYAEGHADAEGGFEAVGDIKQVNVEPATFQTALIKHTNPNLYTDIKNLLYMLLTAETGQIGAVE